MTATFYVSFQLSNECLSKNNNPLISHTTVGHMGIGNMHVHMGERGRDGGPLSGLFFFFFFFFSSSFSSCS